MKILGMAEVATGFLLLLGGAGSLFSCVYSMGASQLSSDMLASKAIQGLIGTILLAIGYGLYRDGKRRIAAKASAAASEGSSGGRERR
ncbi:MAG: hypothetical protein FIA93_08815 [Deltaproteobacteria bacterium]|nr:hypothetical protein [Deltaproteobacteria bacterium]